jgi:hypothetical protein
MNFFHTLEMKDGGEPCFRKGGKERVTKVWQSYEKNPQAVISAMPLPHGGVSPQNPLAIHSWPTPSFVAETASRAQIIEHKNKLRRMWFFVFGRTASAEENVVRGLADWSFPDPHQLKLPIGT